MTRVFEATRIDGIIKINNKIVQNCPVMGEGGNSSGYVVISEDTLFYLPKITPDVKSFITLAENLCTKLEELCTKIAAITVTCAIPGSPSSIPINSADFGTSSEDIMEIHASLTELKGALK